MPSIQGLYEDVPTEKQKGMGVLRVIHILSDMREGGAYKRIDYIPKTGEWRWSLYYYDPKSGRPKCVYSDRSLGRRASLDKLPPKEKEMIENLARKHIWKKI